MDLGHSRNRDLEQNQPQRQEMSHEQRVGQLYNDIDAQSRKNSEVAQVFNRYSGPEQLELKNQIAHAAASAQHQCGCQYKCRFFHRLSFCCFVL